MFFAQRIDRVITPRIAHAEHSPTYWTWANIMLYFSTDLPTYRAGNITIPVLKHAVLQHYLDSNTFHAATQPEQSATITFCAKLISKRVEREQLHMAHSICCYLVLRSTPYLPRNPKGEKKLKIANFLLIVCWFLLCLSIVSKKNALWRQALNTFIYTAVAHADFQI